MTRLKALVAGLMRDENGQASAEYIIMLSAVVMMALIVVKRLIQPTLARLAAGVSQRIEAGFFGKGSLHQLKIGR